MPFGSMAGAAYWIGFAAVFLASAVWETFRPERELSGAAERRWRNHGAMLVMGAIVSTVAFRLSPVALAAMVGASRIGVLNKSWAPLVVRCAIAVLLLDMLQYWIHRSMHLAPWLWRIHSVHHSDADLDVSTSVRHHPIESVYVQGIRLGVIALLAPPAAGVLAAEVLAIMVDVWSHANVLAGAKVDQMVRAVFVTPNMHRIHHSQEAAEQQENLGQIFPWWDRMFGTYAQEPLAGKAGFRPGLSGLEDQDSLGVGFMLAQPFQSRMEENSRAAAS